MQNNFIKKCFQFSESIGYNIWSIKKGENDIFYFNLGQNVICPFSKELHTDNDVSCTAYMNDNKLIYKCNKKCNGDVQLVYILSPNGEFQLETLKNDEDDEEDIQCVPARSIENTKEVDSMTSVSIENTKEKIYCDNEITSKKHENNVKLVDILIPKIPEHLHIFVNMYNDGFDNTHIALILHHFLQNCSKNKIYEFMKQTMHDYIYELSHIVMTLHESIREKKIRASLSKFIKSLCDLAEKLSNYKSRQRIYQIYNIIPTQQITSCV